MFSYICSYLYTYIILGSALLVAHGSSVSFSHLHLSSHSFFVLLFLCQCKFGLVLGDTHVFVVIIPQSRVQGLMGLTQRVILLVVI